jgi:hypothetical protein
MEKGYYFYINNKIIPFYTYERKPNTKGGEFSLSLAAVNILTPPSPPPQIN